MKNFVPSALLLAGAIGAGGAVVAFSLAGCDNTKNGAPAATPADAASGAPAAVAPAAAPAAAVPGKKPDNAGGGGW
jgi:hypothetical protein